MRYLFQQLKTAIVKGDKVLLFLCLSVTAFGCLMICSTTNVWGFTRYLIIQIVAALLGVMMYFIVSAIDMDFMNEHRNLLVGLNCFLLFLLIPFGTDNNTGNWSWLDFPFLPVQIQPAEICKITFIIIMASVMNSHQNKPSAPLSVMHIVLHLGILAGLNMLIARDLGVTLIFVFIFIGMAYTGGVNMFWFLLAGGLLAVGTPILWPLLSDYQQNRIMILFDETIDPNGINERFHTLRSLRSLTGGGLTGQGLFQGIRTQTPNALYAQHTDYIFSAIGEELGYVGCFAVMLMLVAIIIRVIWVGTRSQDYMRRMVCFGAASALIFQVISNVGMCIGLTPVIGLTLPFISYGGSSLVTLYTMLGLVSGVHARPAPTSHERYIRAPLPSHPLRSN